MRRAWFGLILLVSFSLFSQLASVGLADDDNGNETNETWHAVHETDPSVCLSTIFLLMIVLIAISLVIMAFSRGGGPQ
ncbi:MAG: hypothetical protein JSV43_00250 [Methanobacteriota archaeon]|nr:MAG: hypothetical protein JSV43_00250 [Euryarchaeota archaeon]